MKGWHHKKPVQKFDKLNVTTFPLYGENLLVIGLFTIMFSLACIWASLPVGMGIRSVAFWFICITLFFNYAFVIVDYTSRGMQRVPRLSGEMVFPTHDTRLYTIAALTICYLAFLMSGEAELAQGKLIIAFFTYPLMFSLLIVHTSPSKLLNPIGLVKTLYLFSTSKDAVVFYFWQLVTGTVLYLEVTSFGVISAAHILWQVPLTLFLLFITFRALGVALNTKGPSFGLSVLQNAESYQQELEEEAARNLNEFVLKLHRLVRVHEYEQAFDLIKEFQKEEGHDQDDALFIRLSEWEDKGLARRMGTHLAERLMQKGDTQRALKVFRESYDMAPKRFEFSSQTMLERFVDEAKDLASIERLTAYRDRE